VTVGRFKLSRRRLFIALVGLAVAGFVGIQFHHRSLRGHFAPIGLHVDVLWEDASIGGPGPSRMYWPELTNAGLWPSTFEVCNYITDIGSRGRDYAVGLQRWNHQQNAWETASIAALEEECSIPVALSRGAGTLSRAWIWPGLSVEATGAEAIGARGDFANGDLARFVVFRTGNRSPDWRTAVFSDAFRVKGDEPWGFDGKTKH